MTTPAQIALDFCREVLGWERPVDRKYGERERDPHGEPSRAWSPYLFDYHGRHPQFHYSELSAVMPAVQAWCDREGCDLELHYHPRHGGFGVLCGGIDTWNENPCHALLAACVQANRKLRNVA